MDRWVRLLFVSVCLVLGMTSQVQAKPSLLQKYPVELTKEGLTLKRMGVGYRRLLFMKAFDAGFYSLDSVEPRNVLDDVPKFLEVEYYVGIPAKSLTEYTIEHMKLNVSSAMMLQLQEELQLMGQYFVNLKPHDKFSLFYIPGVGTQFAHNGQLRGVIPGEDFALALFSVWVGEKPFDVQLKKKILGMSSLRVSCLKASDELLCV